MSGDLDQRVRLAAFKFLDELTAGSPEGLLSRADLQKGLVFEGTRVSLASPQGIFTPAILDVPLSILTVAVEDGETRPYDDVIGEDGLLKYSTSTSWTFVPTTRSTFARTSCMKWTARC